MRVSWPRGGPSFVALYVLLLAVLLTVPIGKNHLKRGYLNEFHRPLTRRALVDTAVNIVLFVPFGWSVQRALRLRGSNLGAVGAVVTVGVIGAGFSLTMESLQHLLPTRHSSIVDTAYNTLGTLIGAVANQYLD